MKKMKIKKIGAKHAYIQDLFYWVLRVSWPKFIVISMILNLTINSIMASLYYLFKVEIINARVGSFWDAFVFSFQTSSTLGFGHFLPKSDLGHVLVMLDTFSGIFFVAIMTGLAYAKFAKPTARVDFTKNIILTTFDGIPTLMFRMANSRETSIVDVSLKVAALIPYTSTEGSSMRRFYKLDLVTDNNPTFSLSWTAMHQITEQSPLYGMSIDTIHDQGILVFLSMTGIDDVLSQSVHASHRYSTKSIIKAKKFVDILDVSESSSYTLDYTKFHDVIID
jgi:inward rectifier potassium channel